MSEVSFSDGSERFLWSPEVQDSLGVIKNEAAMLSENIASVSTPNYDSLVVFSHTPGEEVANPLAFANANDIHPSRFAFRKEAVLGRSVLLRKTSLGAVLANGRDPRFPRLGHSTINPDYPQFTYTHPLFSGDTPVGAIQQSFTAADRLSGIQDMPDDTEATLKAAFEASAYETKAITDEIIKLQSMSKELGSLGSALELDAPVAPNSFVVRWDVEGSKRFAADTRRRALKAYMNQVHLRIRALTEEYSGKFVNDDQGDGANLIFFIPEKYNTYDPFTLKDYLHYTGTPFIKKIEQELEKIADQYRSDLDPSVRVSGEFTYTERNSIGRYVANEMYLLGNQKAK